jgi:AraC-like DNA-binding protein
MKHQSSPCGEPETPLERKEAVPQKVFHRTGHFSLLASIGILLVQLNSVVASSRQSQPQNIQHNERRLQPGDGFNLTLPDIRFEDNVLSADLIIDLRRVTCRALVIDTMEFYLQPPFGSGIPLYLALRDISITCESDYEYQFLFANGGGSAEFDAHQSNIESQLVFTSPNLFEHPPNDVWFNECTSNVVLDRLDIQAETSGLVSQALGISEPLILPVLENEIGATLCDQIRALDTELAEFLLQFTEQWEPYWQGTSIPYEALDPATVPADALDLQQPADTDLGKLLDFVIAEGSDWLSSDSSGTADAWDISDLLTSDMGDPFSDLLQQSSFETSTVLGMLHMSFDRIETIGFDSAIEEIYPIEIVDSFLLRTGVVISNLTVNIDFTIALRPLNGTSVTKYTSNVSFPVERLDASASLLVLTSESTLGALQLGSLLDSKGLIGCISSGFDRLEVVRVQIDEFVLSESSSFSTSTGWITNILESNLTTDALSSALEGVTSGDCSEVPEFEGTVDLRDLLLSPALSKEYGGSGTEPYGNIGPLFKEYIDESLLTVDEMGRIELLKTLMTAIGQNDSTDDGVLRLDYDFDIDEDLTLGNSRIGLELSLSKLEVQNLAVIASPVTILDPILGQAHRTKNSIVIGKEEAPLKLSARLVFGLSVDDSEMRNVVDISLSFWKLDVSTVLILRMAEKYLMEFPLKSLFDINCLLSLLHTPELDSRGVRLPSVEASLSLEELQILLQGFRLEIDCISCTTEIEELSAKLREPSGGNLATSAVNNFISLLLGFAEDDDSFAQLQIDRYLVEAAQQCDFRDEYDPNFRGIFYEYFATSSESSISSFRALLVMLGVIGGIVLFTVVVMKLLSLVALRRHRLWLKNLPRPQLLAVYTSQQANEVRSRQLDLKSSSLVCSSHVPGPIRLLVPVVLLGNIALFLSGHFSQGGSVMIFIQFAGKKFQIDNFYDFSIFQSALDLWKAGGKELAVLIFLFSVIWPYTKIVITLVLWVAPPRLVSIRRRGSMLIWLE